MTREEFKKYIESIGFKKYVIDLYNNYYNFHNGSKWYYDIYYNDLRPLENEFKQELRSIKLKKILG